MLSPKERVRGMGDRTCRVVKISVVNRMVRIDIIEKVEYEERQERRKPSS